MILYALLSTLYSLASLLFIYWDPPLEFLSYLSPAPLIYFPMLFMIEGGEYFNMLLLLLIFVLTLYLLPLIGWSLLLANRPAGKKLIRIPCKIQLITVAVECCLLLMSIVGFVYATTSEPLLFLPVLVGILLPSFTLKALSVWNPQC